MFTFSFADLVSLHKAFSDVPIHRTILEYYAEPRIPIQNYNYNACVDALRHRQSSSEVMLGMAPQDVYIYRNRFNLLKNSNEAYTIATMENPTILAITTLSYLSTGWATLFPIKQALIHHIIDWHTTEYRGFLPFGSAVIAYYNSLIQVIEPTRKTIGNSPNFQDHSHLQKISNEMAPALGITTVELNNYMYLEGLKLLKPKTVTSVE